MFYLDLQFNETYFIIRFLKGTVNVIVSGPQQMEWIHNDILKIIFICGFSAKVTRAFSALETM